MEVVMEKIKKIKIEYVLCFFIIICPILDIASFIFRNYFETTISISTFLRPLIPTILAIYIFIKANKKHKKILLSIASIYIIYGIIHLFVAKSFQTGCSYGGTKEEMQYVMNFSFLIVNLVVFLYTYSNIKWRKKNLEYKTEIEKLRIAIFIMSSIYILSIYIAILTKTSSYTYEEVKIGYKGWIESGNSLSAILCISIFTILPLIKEKKYTIPVVIIISLIAIYLVALIGTRTGLLGFFLAVAVFITIEVIFSKNKVAIAGFIILAIAVIVVGLVGSSTLKRRSQINEAQYTIIDEATGEVRTYDRRYAKNKKPNISRNIRRRIHVRSTKKSSIRFI